MELGIKGKKALVTGASSGLGAAAALALAAEGVEVVINSRSEERLKAAAGRIAASTGYEPRYVVGDISLTWDIDSIVRAAGPVDILVSNTGGPPAGLFTDLAPEQWEESAKLLLDSAVGLTRAALPGMMDRQWGRLIYITSMAVLQPLDDLILSNTYRSGLTGFCKTISNTYARYGITANTVCPGYTATERIQELAGSRAMKARTTSDEIIKDMAASVPARRLGKPEEIAALITFLASEQASYITGSSIAVDGGAHKFII
jgi:3-oxoacyl-[acyl-carrier protein] reductase